jgi:hypothetical protein
MVALLPIHEVWITFWYQLRRDIDLFRWKKDGQKKLNCSSTIGVYSGYAKFKLIPCYLINYMKIYTRKGKNELSVGLRWDPT